MYNALITTDQNLTPSRAIPVIQPHIHETSYYPYSFNTFNPFGAFDPYSQLSNVLNSKEYQSRKAIAGDDVGSRAVGGNGDISPVNTPSFAVVSGTAGDRPSTDNSPIPVNEFGLPPSLVPLSYAGGINDNPISLAPFNFNSFNPLIYDQFNGYAPSGYLPHFNYYPPAIYGFPNQRKPVLVPGGGAIGNDNGAGPNRNDQGGVPLNPGLASEGSAGPLGTTGDGGTGFGSTGDGADNQVNYSRDDDAVGAASAASNGNNNNAAGASGSASSASGGGSGGGSSGGSGGGSSGSGAESGGSASSSSGGGSSSSQSSSGGGSSSRSFSRSGRTFTITDERIKNFPNKIKEIHDVPPPPLPYGARTFDDE